jgi:hypothetical protein
MTRPRSGHLHPAWAALAIFGLSTACRSSDRVRQSSGSIDTTDTSGMTDRDTLPTGCPANRPPKNRKELDTCVGGLKFDTEGVVGDEQRLLLVDTTGRVGTPCPYDTRQRCRHGPLAKIEPAVGSIGYTDDDLKHGRFLARLFVRRGEKGYPKLALTPGDTTYWWVQTDNTGERGRSLFISQATLGDSLVSRAESLTVERAGAGSFKRAMARWHWLDWDETGKGTCTGTSTCTSSGGK